MGVGDVRGVRSVRRVLHVGYGVLRLRMHVACLLRRATRQQ